MNAPTTFAPAVETGAPAVPRGLWVMGWVLGSALFLIDLSQLDNGMVLSFTYWGRDFINVWTGGELIRAGDLKTLYDVEAYRTYQQALFGPVEGHSYSYSPISFPLAALFSVPPYWLALPLWLASTGGLFVLAVRRFWPDGAGPLWFALLTPAALVCIWAGHYGFLVGALFLLGWSELDRRPLQAGVWFGLMLLKPHLAVLVPIVLLCRREWTAIAGAAATVAVLLLLTTLAFGIEPWRVYLVEVSRNQAAYIAANLSFAALMTTSAVTGVFRLTGSLSLGFAVQAALGIMAIGTVVRAALRGPRRTRELAFMTATATFLVLPYAFNYDLTVVAVGALWMVLKARPPVETRIAELAFAAPLIGMLTAAAAVPLLPLSLAGLLWVQWRAFNRQTVGEEYRLSPVTT